MTASDELNSTRAAQLRRALATHNHLDAASHEWRDLHEDAARDVADRLYGALGARSSATWKLGAIDREAQDHLGLSSPLVAPMVSEHVRRRVAAVEIRLDDLHQPRFEAEIGLIIGPGSIVPVPCVEVAGCRFRDWVLPPAGAIADLGLQGRLLFGQAGEPKETFSVEVSHDGKVVSTGEINWDDVVARTALLDGREHVRTVATGSVTPLLPAEPGHWSFRFLDLGVIDVSVT